MNRRTIVVEGPLAFRMRRIDAARRAEAGVQIMGLPQLAARLVGGFVRPARSQDLDPAIRSALKAGGFVDLESIRELPGMTRSLAWTLSRVWHADFPLVDHVSGRPRLQDLATIEDHVRRHLPTGVRLPGDLRDLAMQRVNLAPAVLGDVELDRVVSIAPVWRPLLHALSGSVRLTWRNPGTVDVDWFPGAIVVEKKSEPAAPDVVSCVAPRAEVVEALRWMRELVSSGRASPGEIGICATSTEDWDNDMLVLATDAGLPLHFSHGIPALASREGQACAALADVLLNGLSQDRVHRLVGHAVGRSTGLAKLPRTWALGVQAGAALFEFDQWRHALTEAYQRRTDGIDIRQTLLPILELLATGSQAAIKAAEVLLGPSAQALWAEALRRAPPEALEFSLQELRIPDGRDPGACAVWCPASHLAAAPRPWVRLLGMTTRCWPRRVREDPLIPNHLLPDAKLDFDTVTQLDRRSFHVIVTSAVRGCVLSRSRRNAQGSLQAASPLLPQELTTVALKRSRVPRHAFSEIDRLMARPEDAADTPAIAIPGVCWENWEKPAVTFHDGRVRSDHPIIVRAIDQVQSATSLRLLMRDPLAFVWRYALGWQSLAENEQPLSLDTRVYGELVHDLLKRAVDLLEPNPGYGRASPLEIEGALDTAIEAISADWPLSRSVPPRLLWQHTLAAARNLALKALTLDEAFQPSTRSWTELAFGGDSQEAAQPDLLWPLTAEVVIPGTDVRIRGSIDRLDFNSVRNGVRVSDYKTGTEPPKAQDIVIGQGAELQRVLYALAARELVPDNPRIIARLVFLGDERPKQYKLNDVDRAIADVGVHVLAAIDNLRRGVSLPGPDAKEDWNDYRLALPATRASYLQVKKAAFSRAFGNFALIWSAR